MVNVKVRIGKIEMLYRGFTRNAMHKVALWLLGICGQLTGLRIFLAAKT